MRQFSIAPTFHAAQLSFIDSDNSDKGTILIVGLKKICCGDMPNTYFYGPKVLKL